MIRALFVSLFSTIVVFLSYSQDEVIPTENEPRDTIRKTGEVFDADVNVLVAPEGFIVSEHFHGYMHPQKASSIIMSELAGVGYYQMEGSMNDSYYEGNNLEFISKEPLLTKYGTKGFVFKMSFEQSGLTFIRIVVLAGDFTHTLWLHITYPEKFDDEIGEQMLESLNTINFYPLED